MSIFVSLTGGMRLFEIDTEQEPVTFTPEEYSPVVSEPAEGYLSLGVTVCGCISLFQHEVQFGFAIITENSSKSIVSPTYRPIITEDGNYYLITEQDMAEPLKVTELSEANVADIIANAAGADMLLSYNGQSYKMSFADLINFIKAINENVVFNYTKVGDGNSFTVDDIDNREVYVIFDGNQAYNRQPINFTQVGNTITAEGASFYDGQVLTIMIKH